MSEQWRSPLSASTTSMGCRCFMTPGRCLRIAYWMRVPPRAVTRHSLGTAVADPVYREQMIVVRQQKLIPRAARPLPPSDSARLGTRCRRQRFQPGGEFRHMLGLKNHNSLAGQSAHEAAGEAPRGL